MSLRSIQSTIERFYTTKISFHLIQRWIKASQKLLSIDVEEVEKPKPTTIKVLELDELHSYFTNLKKNEKNQLKYGLLLIGTDIKLLRVE
jgi:hypothetical protein